MDSSQNTGANQFPPPTAQPPQSVSDPVGFADVQNNPFFDVPLEQPMQAPQVSSSEHLQQQPMQSPAPTPPAAPPPVMPPPTAQAPQPEEVAPPQRVSEPSPQDLMVGKEEVLFEWKAPSRPFKRQSRQFYTTIGVIALLIGLILFFAGQVLPVAVVFAVVFMSYILYTTPPTVVVHKLTTYGIRIEDSLYYWDELGRFWFTEKYGEPLLHIEVGRFPNRLTILLGSVEKDYMEYVLQAVLPMEQPPLTAYEKAAKWLQEKIPISLD